MNPLDFVEKLAGLCQRWRSRWGYWSIAALLAVAGAGLGHFVSLSDQGIEWFCGAIVTIWTAGWWYGTRRVVIPSSKPTIAFCFDVELEGERNYRRVIRKIRKQLSDLQLDRDIRVLQVGPGVIESDSNAATFCSRFGTHQVVWGTANYGSIAGEQMLKFDVSYRLATNDVIVRNIEQFQRDFMVLAQGRQFTIKNVNDLIDVQVVADDFLEISLALIAIQCLTSGATGDAVKILSLVVARLTTKNHKASTKERIQQARRLNEILHGGMAHQARLSHEHGDHGTAISLLRQLLPAYPGNIDIRLTLARALYYAGDVKAAVQQTTDILRIDGACPSAFINQAFFSILRKKYDDAGKWYERFRSSKRALTVSLETVTQFLDDRYGERPGEHAFLYGLAIVNGLDDPKAMSADLEEFLGKTDGMFEYYPLRKRSAELLKALKLA